jgi:hypothetical protein
MSTSTQLEDMAVANIALAEITDEVTMKSYIFDTAESGDLTPDLSQGKEDILRVKNRIIAMNRTEDICIGYDIKLKNNTLTPELLAIIDGGTYDETGYQGPPVGVVVNRHPYTLKLYTEQKDYDSSTVKYVVFEFRHCKGKPVTYKAEDGKFVVPEFESHSRPKKNERPIYITYTNTLPNGETSDGGSGATVPSPPTPTTPDSSTDTPGVTVSSDCRVTWTFPEAVNDADVTTTNFKVTRKSDGTAVSGNVTMDTAKKVITFVPLSIAAGVTYEATAASIRKADGSGDTTAVTVEFSTI